jgi:hypothetical protein
MKFLVLLLAVVLLSGCARYSVTVNPDGSKDVSIWSWRSFPEGATVTYSDDGFQFGAPTVTTPEVNMNDILNLLRAAQQVPPE